MRGGQRAIVGSWRPRRAGNKRFAGPTHQAPRFAERGLPGEETWITLRLKLLADVGLIGLPNAGKSSLLARLTRAAPEVADYPFTTVQPVLGTLDGEQRQLVLADIPGLIEGASTGAGLGHEFLAHVERTRLLVHVLDLSPFDGSDPTVNHATVERELERHDRRLASLPRILALSKADLVDEARRAGARAEWEARLGPEVPVIVTSAVSGLGLRRARRRAVPSGAGFSERPAAVVDGADLARRARRAPGVQAGGAPQLHGTTHRGGQLRVTGRRHRAPDGAATTSTTKRRSPTSNGACGGSA